MSDHSHHPAPKPSDSVFKFAVEFIEGLIPRPLYMVLYFAALFIFVEITLTWVINSLFDDWSGKYVFLFGVVVWIMWGSSKVGQFLAAVPKVTGLLTVNLYTGEMKPWGTGLHIKYPWEDVQKSNYIDMRVRGQEIPETYPSKSGSMMHVKWSFQYQPILELLPRYISVSDEGIKKGMRDIGSSALSVRISQLEPDDVKRQQGEMEEALRKSISDHDPEPEDLYGVRLTKVALADIDFDPTVQKARSAKDVAERLNRIAAAIKKDNPGISDKDAMNAAMIANGNITKQVFEVEGAGPALEALLKLFKGGTK